jgi:hypothetical protein
MRVPRWFARVIALLSLAVVLVVVPLVVVSLVGTPVPSITDLAEAWRQRRVPGTIVVRTGALVFALLWAWFAATAVGELWNIMRCRREPTGPAPLPSGPGGWVRMLVRVAAIGSVSATALAGGLAPMLRSATTSNAEVRNAQVVRVTAAALPADESTASAGGGELVSSGRETPYSLAAALGGAPEVRTAIIELNTGRPTPDGGMWSGGVFPAGMTVLLPDVSGAAAPSSSAAAADAERSGGSTTIAFASGLGTALLLSAGAMSLLEARRRRQWRAATTTARLPAPTPTAVRTEALLRVLDAPERLARLDLALRAAAAPIADQGAVVVAAVLGDRGGVCLHLRGSAVPDDERWSFDPHREVWSLRPEVDIADLAAAARGVQQPCPAMIHVGAVVGGGELFVDIEAAGVLRVESTHAEPIMRAVASSLAVSPFLEVARVFVAGLGESWLSSYRCEPMDSADAAVEAARMALGSTPSSARGTSTFALRTSGRGGESWEPAIVVSLGGALDGATLDDVHAIGCGAGLAVVTDASDDDWPPTAHWSLREEDGGHVLYPLGLVVHPVGISAAEVGAVRDLLAASEAEPELHAPVVPIDAIRPPVEPGEFVEREWALMVRVMGPVEVSSSEGVVAAFERSKALELVVWLSQHRERPTRTAARTALWDLDVRDATFANVVSEARRALARASAPADDAEWIPRTLTEDLPLHHQVVTDADLLADRVAAARGLRAAEAVDMLRPGVALLGGLPFAGTGYLWPDAEGVTSSLVLLATGAAIELAQHYLALGDVEGVFWATGQGLRVLAGHEELIALRMRAHARRGDLAGVRSEWDSYERALAADPWAAAEPAAKLVNLRRELLSGERATA